MKMRMKRILITLSLSLVMILGISLSAYAAPQLATDADFEFITRSDAPNTYNIDSTAKKGYFHYKGNKSEVIIPKTIMGNELKDTYQMFFHNGDGTKKVGAVAGDNGVPVTKVELQEGNSVTNMNSMFYMSQATALDISSFDTSNVTDMGNMLRGTQATTLDLSSFDTSNVTTMSSMFYNTQATTLDLSSFDTSNVTTMYAMFSSSQATTLDLSSFDTSNVTTMSFMFRDSQATTLDLSSFDTSNVTNMGNMLRGTQATTLDLSSFDTSNVTTMSFMFYNSQATTLDLSSFDTSNVTTMTSMFASSQATTGYARTTTDANNFNSSSNKPEALTFIVRVTGITLNKSNTSIPKGLSETLIATINPSDATNKNISWSSSNTSVATVSSTGLVTAIGLGTAIITVTTQDGNKTTTCEVTVSQYGFNAETGTITGYYGPGGNVVIPSTIGGVDVTSIGDSAFEGCTSLTSIIIPNSVTSIGIHAFYNCMNLTSINIPDGVTSISNGAFRRCTNLTSIIIPDIVTSIGSSAFEGCTNLTSITIPSSVTDIRNNAFESCTSLTSITIPNSVATIGNDAFYNCVNLTSINIPDGVTSIGNGTFQGCTNLTSIIIPSRVTSIGNSAFRDCTSLTTVIIPSSVTTIGNGAFQGCIGLTSITIPDSVTTIGKVAFSGCIGLTSITIPDSVTSIGINAFGGCDSLTITCYETSPTHLYAVDNNIEFDFLPPYVLSLEINPSSLTSTIARNINYEVIATLSNSEEINVNNLATWDVSDSSIAYILELGTIRTKSPGTVTVTATYGDSQAQATLTVISDPVIMTINPASSMLETGGTQELTVTIQYGAEEPIDVTNECSWVVANNNKATLTNNIVTAVDSGMTSITAKYQEFQVTSFITIKDYRESEFKPDELGNRDIDAPKPDEREPGDTGTGGIKINPGTSKDWAAFTVGSSGNTVIVPGSGKAWTPLDKGLGLINVNTGQSVVWSPAEGNKAGNKLISTGGTKGWTPNKNQGGVSVNSPGHEPRNIEGGKQGEITIVIR